MSVFLFAKQLCELAVKLSELWITILMSISNDSLINSKYDLSSKKEKGALFLDNCMQFVKSFYFDGCKLLNADTFIFILKTFKQTFIMIQTLCRLLINLI